MRNSTIGKNCKNEEKKKEIRKTQISAAKETKLNKM